MLFVTRKGKVESHANPYEAAEVVSTYDAKGASVAVVGRVRNKYNNLWLLLSDGSYVWADNLAFNLDKTMKLSCERIVEYSKFGEENASLRWLSGMFKNFKTGGSFDFKQGNLLGVNTYEYYVLVGGKVQKERFTGEEIGNINYGYVASYFGLSEVLTIQYGGLGGKLSSGLTEKEKATTLMCFFGELDFCDDADDIESVKRGWRYFDTGKWK